MFEFVCIKVSLFYKWLPLPRIAVHAKHVEIFKLTKATKIICPLLFTWKQMSAVGVALSHSLPWALLTSSTLPRATGLPLVLPLTFPLLGSVFTQVTLCHGPWAERSPPLPFSSTTCLSIWLRGTAGSPWRCIS